MIIFYALLLLLLTKTVTEVFYLPGHYRVVRWKSYDVSEEHVTSIFRISFFAGSSTMKIQAAGCFETLVRTYEATRYDAQKIIYIHRRVSLSHSGQCFQLKTFPCPFRNLDLSLLYRIRRLVIDPTI
jgi:hypothetical protein